MSDSRSELMETAFEVAQIRAEESLRPDRLFADPYAMPLLQGGGGTFRPAGEVAGANRLLADVVAVRTRFYDDYLRAARTSGCEQIVLLAAGLDSRAYRLQWPWPTVLFELDHAELLLFKDKALADMRATPRCGRTVVPVDLRTDWLRVLMDVGYRQDRATAWLAEGIMGYLPEQDADRLLAQVSSVSSRGSQIALEHLSVLDALLTAAAPITVHSPSVRRLWEGGLGSTASGRISHLGWDITIHDLVMTAESYGRSLDTGPRRPDSSGFITGIAP